METAGIPIWTSGSGPALQNIWRTNCHGTRSRCTSVMYGLWCVCVRVPIVLVLFSLHEPDGHLQSKTKCACCCLPSVELSAPPPASSSYTHTQYARFLFTASFGPMDKRMHVAIGWFACRSALARGSICVKGHSECAIREWWLGSLTRLHIQMRTKMCAPLHTSTFHFEEIMHVSFGFRIACTSHRVHP